MVFDEDRRNANKAKDIYAEGKRTARNGWADAKAAAEKTRNNVEAEIDKL